MVLNSKALRIATYVIAYSIQESLSSSANGNNKVDTNNDNAIALPNSSITFLTAYYS